jgi:DNA-binding response OmpR family regulator
MDLLYGTEHGEEVESMRDSHFPASKKTIMVVDDNHDIVEILRTMLEENGFNVRCAYSGEELFAALEKQKSDLIFLDIMMPKMDGFEVLTRLKWEAATASIPVILLTAKVYHKDVEKGYKLGTEYYIKKPFTITEVITNINRLLSKDQRHSELSQSVQ